MRLIIDLPAAAVPTTKGVAQVRHDIYEAVVFYWLARGEPTAETAASLGRAVPAARVQLPQLAGLFNRPLEAR